MSLPSVSGIAIPVLSGSHVWTREHFANRPDIEFLRDSVTGNKVYVNQTFHKIDAFNGTTTSITWITSGSPPAGQAIYLSGLTQINLSGIVVSGPSVSGIVGASGLLH